MTGYVERGDIPGIVTLRGRSDALHVEALGTTTIGGKDPMHRDTIFRVASITHVSVCVTPVGNGTSAGTAPPCLVLA